MLFKILRFGITGTTAAGINLLVLYFLVNFLNLYYLIATVPAFLVAMLWNFVLQKFWTFRVGELTRLYSEFATFALINCTNIIINMALMYVLVSLLDIWYIAAQVVAALIIAVLSFLGYDRLVFVQQGRGSSPPESVTPIPPRA